MAEQHNNETLTPEARTRQRDQTASDLVKALLLINGGGAGALLAFLQAIWATDKGLAKPTIAAIVILAFGACMGAAFHLFRYHASSYQQQGQSRWKTFRCLYFVSAYISLICFVAGIVVVAIGAWRLL
jgi:hypothetical protein